MLMFLKVVWHRRLGHPSFKILKSIVKSCNLLVKENEQLLLLFFYYYFFGYCQLGKAHALPFPISQFRATIIFDLIHTDLWGLVPITSMDGYRYYSLFVDDYN